MLRKSVTQQYPEVKPALPPRSRGVIALVEENCTSCMLCARECPDWCIYIDSHKETVPAPEGGRPRQRNVLDRFAIDFALCMYCGICIEVCPFDALFWSPEFEYAEGDIRNLLHEKDRLSTWSQTVPPPPSHDPGAEPPKELTAAPRRPAGRATPGTPTPADRPARESRAAKTSHPPTPTDTPAPSPGPATPPPAVTPEAPSGALHAETAPPQQPDAGTGGTSTGGTGTGGTGTAGVEGPQSPTAAQPPTAAPAPGPEPGRQGQEAEAGTPGRPQRPRRAMSNVRGIRPPGTLPARPAGDTPATRADDASAAKAAAAPSSSGTSPAEAPPRPAAPPARRTAAEGGDEEPQGPQPTGEPSSTGGPTEEELSTGSGETRSKPDPEEQTAAPSPRRRRMADPRSIRPPGRLGPDEPKEPEEES
ncbi:NuoI/complex I 23 kDa subunit family protein [Nonomuraea wenchangensis]|nr:NADH-quinone oxidoreductase subunit I [Nonomuraea wenchangensis]